MTINLVEMPKKDILTISSALERVKEIVGDDLKDVVLDSVSFVIQTSGGEVATINLGNNDVFNSIAMFEIAKSSLIDMYKYGADDGDED